MMKAHLGCADYLLEQKVTIQVPKNKNDSDSSRNENNDDKNNSSDKNNSKHQQQQHRHLHRQLPTKPIISFFWKVEINILDDEGRSLVAQALDPFTKQSLEQVKYLVKEKRADCTKSDKDGFTPLVCLLVVEFDCSCFVSWLFLLLLLVACWLLAVVLCCLLVQSMEYVKTSVKETGACTPDMVGVCVFCILFAPNLFNNYMLACTCSC